MKKSRFLWLALILALIMSVSAVTAFAAGEPTLTVKTTSLELENAVYMNFKVQSQNISDTSSVKLLVWESYPGEYVKGTEDAELSVMKTEAGTGYLVFQYTDLAAKDMTKFVYVCAYAKVNGEDVYSKPTKFSIVQYAYNTQTNASAAANLKTLVNNMLAYGASAQTYFNHNTDFLATDPIVKIRVEGGTHADGFKTMYYQKGELATFIADAPAEGMVFSHWENSKGISVGTSSTLSIAVNADDTYTAVYKEIGVATECLLFTLSDDQSYYIVNGFADGCTTTDLVIPESHNGLPVKKIADMAFFEIKLNSLVVPSSVEEIGNFAFIMCNIDDLTLNEGLRIIGTSAITSCDEFVTIPSTVTHIGNYFYCYNGGARPNFFSGVTFLGDCPEFTDGDPFMESFYYEYDPATEGWPGAGGEMYSGTFYPIGWKQDVGDTTYEEQRKIYNQSVINFANTVYLSDDIQWAEHMRVVTDEKELQVFKALSDEICRGLTTPDEKIRAIYDWVSTNLVYDNSYLYTNLSQCLADRRAVCAQYSLISIQLMRLQNIPAVYISGTMGVKGSSVEETLDLALKEEMAHGWLLAYNGERWLWIDPTNKLYDFDYWENWGFLAISVEGVSDIRNEKMQYNSWMSTVYTENGFKSVACWVDYDNNPHVVGYLGSVCSVNLIYDINRQFASNGQPYTDGWFTTHYGKTVYCLSDGRALTNGTYLIDGELYTFDGTGFLVE